MQHENRQELQRQAGLSSLAQELGARLTGQNGPFEQYLDEASGLRLFRIPPRSLTDLYRRARRHGSKVLLVTRDGEITYEALFRRADAMSGAIAATGLWGESQRAALAISAPDDWLAAFVALSAQGIPVVLLPEGLAAGDRAALLERTQCNVLIDETVLAELEAQPAGSPEIAPSIEPDEDALALIAFTSGSTGLPKGVQCDRLGVMTGMRNMLLAGALASMVERASTSQGSLAPQRPAQPCTLLLAPLSHVSGYAQALLAMAVGGKLVVAPGANAEEVAKLVTRHGVRSLSGASPAFVELLLANVGDPGIDLSTIATVNIHGIQVPAQFRACLKDLLPEARIAGGYGLTETNGAIAIAIAEDSAVSMSAPVFLLPGVEAKAVDPEGIDVPNGVVGEICVRGAMTMRGYCGDFDLARGDWLRTGDLGFCGADQTITILGRMRHVLPGAVRPIAIEEIERLAQQYSGGQEVAAIADETTDPKTLELFLSGQSGEAEFLEIQDKIARLLAGDWKIFVKKMSKFGRTRSGKINKADLLRMSATKMY